MVAEVFATNCCVVVAGSGESGADAVIIDAGAGSYAQLVSLIEERGWRLRGVLVTHGHADHTWDAAKLCAHFDVPFYIHADDAYRLADPIGTLIPPGAVPSMSVGAAIRAAVAQIGEPVESYQAPANVSTFTNEAALPFGTFDLILNHAPGHTEGSTIYISDEVAFTGDVLFAGSIGRTDLPGGDYVTMAATLERLKSELNPDLQIIPGHGPASTVARELATNPYLR